jgi:hypothetical protein
MAYPTISAPYGLRPINLIGGQVFAGQTRLRRIATSYTTNIFFGDPVKLVADGTIERATNESDAPNEGFAGVFMGCTYVSAATKQPTWSQYWPGVSVVSGTVIQAYIADDPDQLFQVVGCSSGTTVDDTNTAFQYTAIGCNVALINNAGDANTGDSRQAVGTTTETTTKTLPLRIVDVVPDTAFVISSTTYYPEVIVKWNMPNVNGDGTPQGGHAYYNPLGLAA